MLNVKNHKLVLSTRPNLLTIRPSTSLSQALKKLTKSKKIDFVLVERARADQMLAVLIARLIGKKFVWIQEFSNPPSANLLSRFLLTQADNVLAKTRDDAIKLKSFGVKNGRVHYNK